MSFASSLAVDLSCQEDHLYFFIFSFRFYYFIHIYIFHQNPILMKYIDINEIVKSNKFPFDEQDFKYSIGYKYNKEIRPLWIFFPETIICKRYSDKTKCMYLMTKDDFFDKYMIIWEKIAI